VDRAGKSQGICNTKEEAMSNEILNPDQVVPVGFWGPVEELYCDGDVRLAVWIGMEFELVRRFFKVLPEDRCVEDDPGLLKDHMRLVAWAIERESLDPPPLVAGLTPWHEEQVSWPGEHDRDDDVCFVRVDVHRPLPLLPEYLIGIPCSPLVGWYTYVALGLLRDQAERRGDLERVREIDQFELSVCVILDSRDSEAARSQAQGGCPCLHDGEEIGRVPASWAASSGC
jgi:hypothetical protein